MDRSDGSLRTASYGSPGPAIRHLAQFNSIADGYLGVDACHIRTRSCRRAASVLSAGAVAAVAAGLPSPVPTVRQPLNPSSSRQPAVNASAAARPELVVDYPAVGAGENGLVAN